MRLAIEGRSIPNTYMPTYTVSKEFSFEGAHSLPHLPEGHKCRNVHGHSYKVIVVVASASLDPARHWVVDYADISTVVDPIIARLDHQNLNDILSVPSTAENLAKFIYDGIKGALPHLASVEVKETEKTSVIYRDQNPNNPEENAAWICGDSK